MVEVHDHIINLLATRAKDFEIPAEAFARSRIMLLSSEYGDNAEERAALQNIAEGIKCTVNASDDGVSLSIDYDSRDPGGYLSVVDGGLEAPQTGGKHGTVTMPDGSTRHSNVPSVLWGNPIEEYAEPPSGVVEEIKMMLTDLFKEHLSLLIAENKSEIAKAVKAAIENEQHQISS